MKTKSIILFLFLSAVTLSPSRATTFLRQTGGTACAAVDDEVLPNDAVEEPAQYPGGQTAILDDLERNLVYPQKALSDKLFGKVVLRFMIKEDGSIGDVEILKNLSPECDQAAIRTVKSLSKFSPAKNEGKTVRVWFTTPITFTLFEEAEFPGGEPALNNFIAQNLVYPKKAQEKGFYGTVHLSCQVKADGTIGEIKIKESLTPECDKAAIEAMRKLTGFIPAKKNGKPISRWLTVPIAFHTARYEMESSQDPQINPSTALDLSMSLSRFKKLEVSAHYVLSEGMVTDSLAWFPVYPNGGLTRLSVHVKTKLVELPDPSTAGLCTVTALITEEGKLSDISVEQSISQEYDNVILTILSENLEDFSAARDINGRPVPMWLKVNVSYTN